MLRRTLGRNGVVERSMASRRHPSVVKGRYVSIALRHSPGTFTQLRLLATSTPQTKPRPNTSKTPAPLIPGQPPLRKPKVDLKPAPVKPYTAKSTLPAPAVNTQTTRDPQADESKLEALSESTSSQPSPSTSSTQPSSSSTIPGGITEAKLDVQKAEEQGVLAPPPADAGRIRRLWHQAKELFKFYWNGLKMINTHRLQVREIRRRVKEGGEPISRAEYRFIRTYQEDGLKLIPFILVVIIMEELIPLIAIYAPGMLPSTTILPSQRKRIEEKAREKQLTFAARRAAFARIIQAGREGQEGNIGEKLDLRQLRALGGDGMKTVCGMLRLATWGPAPLRLWRIDRHLKHVARDDELLTKEGLGRRLGLDEVGKALDERGIIATKLNQEQARRQLNAWLTSVSFGRDDRDAVARRIYAVAKANA